MVKMFSCQFAIFVYDLNLITNSEIELEGKSLHLTKLQISERSKSDRHVKRSSIEPKEILTRWGSIMYKSETAFCHKIFS